MARSLSALLGDADALISSRVSGSVKVAASAEGDDIFKMAEWVRRSGDASTVKEATAEDISEDDECFTLMDKLAHARAILETYQNLPVLLKMASFEKSAKEKGFSDSQIESYLEKNAAEFPFKSVL